MDSKILDAIIRNVLNEREVEKNFLPTKNERLELSYLDAANDILYKLEPEEKIDDIGKVKKAVEGILDISDARTNENFEIGVAVGLHLHNVLTELLNKPLDTLKKMFENYPTFEDMHYKALSNISEFTEEKYIL